MSYEPSVTEHFGILETWVLALVGSNLGSKLRSGRTVVKLPHGIKTIFEDAYMQNLLFSKWASLAH